MNARANAIARQGAEIDASTRRAVAARIAEGPRRMSAMEAMSTRLGVNGDELIDSLRATVFAGCRNQAEFLALIVVANEYKLNPLTKEIYAFPGKGGGVVPMVSIDGWISLMNRHDQFDGIEFEYTPDDKGGIEAIEAIIHRKDRTHPIKVIEYLEECKRNTDPWKNSPRRMLRHRALIQCVRVAFGFTGVYAPEDDGLLEGQFNSVAQTPSLPSNAEFDRQAAAKAREEEADPETGEIRRDARTGMSEVDEETARALDQQQEGGRADHEHGDQHDGAEQPSGPVADLLARIAAAKNKAALKLLDEEFLRIGGGLTDQDYEHVETALNDKSKSFARAS
jgi:phage recombination protein Bet